MITWTEDRVARLKELIGHRLNGAEIAAAMGGSTKAVYSQTHKMQLQLYSDDTAPTRNILRKRIPVIREDCGGSVGRRWTFAHRSGDIVLDGDYLDALVEIGLLRTFVIHGGEVYGLVDP